MKITLEATGTVERVQGTPCRKWIGATDSGTPVHAWIAIVQPQTHDAAALAAFERALCEVKLERQLVAIDLWLVM